MALSVYPATPKPAYSYLLDHQYKTLVTDFETGTEERTRRWRFPKRAFNLVYKLKEFTVSERDAIYEFFQNRLGTFEPFWYFDLQSRKWIDQYVGTGDGSEDTFDLPGNGTVAAVYVDGIGTVDFTYSAGTGEGGADQIIFDTAPPISTILTTDFTGYLRIKGRFKDDKLIEEISTTHLVNMSVLIMEIKTSVETIKGYLLDIAGDQILDVDGNPIMEVS